MEKTAGELKSEFQKLVQSIVDGDDVALEDTDRAMQTLRSLEGLKLSSEKGVPADDQLPDEFKCPFSGELMEDPVIIASGQTYDRGAIKDWLEIGNLICPKTKQHLSHTFLTPNVLVKEMILKWRNENAIAQPTSSSSSNVGNVERVGGSALSAWADKQILLHHLKKLSSSSIDDQKMAAKEIRKRTKKSQMTRSLFGELPDALPQVIQKLSSNNDADVEEDFITALLNISILESNKKLLAENSDVIPVIIKSLKSQRAVTRSSAAAALFSLSALESNKRAIGESGALKPLIELVDEAQPVVMKDAAAALFSLCIFPENKSRVVAHGAVPVIIQKIRDGILADELLSLLALLCNHGDGVEEMVEADAVSLLLGIMRNDANELNKENALLTICSICSVDKRQLRNVDKEESKHGTLYLIGLRGTTRAKRKANALLQSLNT